MTAAELFTSKRLPEGVQRRGCSAAIAREKPGWLLERVMNLVICASTAAAVTLSGCASASTGRRRTDPGASDVRRALEGLGFHESSEDRGDNMGSYSGVRP